MSAPPLKRGMVIRHQNHVYEITDFQEHHAGKQKPTVHVALRDVHDGRRVDRTLNDLLPLVAVEYVWRRMQYSYAKGKVRVFMDCETFEEVELTDDHLSGRADFLIEGNEYRVTVIDGTPSSVDIPDIIALKVALTAPSEHAVGTASNITKEATLENGLIVRVPLFIKTGDVIRVDTRTKAYAGKEHG